MDTKEIICGVGGFLGSNLRRKFEDEDKEVVILPVEKLLDPPAIHALFKASEPYNLYYLAAYGNLHGQNNIHEIYQASITKLLHVLKATEDTDCRAILTAGSTSEYGNKLAPMKEDQLLEPRTFYGAAKAAATHLAQAWAIQKKSPIVVFRPASITGLGEQSIHLIPTLIRSCMFGDEIPFVSDPVHDYINVRDVCSALGILAEAAANHSGEIFNVGNGIQHTNLEVREMIEEITGRKANITKSVKLNPQNISDVWIADSTKMRNLGWKPKITLYDSLKEMVRSI
jgi:nucleoside-diphosphate-sugar epimerase